MWVTLETDLPGHPAFSDEDFRNSKKEPDWVNAMKGD